MRSSKLAIGVLATLLPTTFCQSTSAPIVTGNPPGAQYIATLPNNASLPNGNIVISSAPDGDGVNVQVSVANLPSSGGPFLYHIHLNPIDSSGNCSTAGAHLDPYNVTEAFVCDPKDPQNCQVGDLSGKHAAMENGTSFAANYVDKYISTQPGTPAFVGNRSLVVHFANKTILTCANFTIPGAPQGSALSASAGTSVMIVNGPAGPAASAGTSTVIVSGSASPPQGTAVTVVNPAGQAPTPAVQAPAASTATIVAGGSTMVVTVVPTGSPPAGTPGVMPNFTPGLNPTAPPTVTVAILVTTAPPGTSILATVNTPLPQTAVGTTTFPNPATSTLPSGVSAVTSMITILVGPGGSGSPAAAPSTITLTMLPTPGSTVLSGTPVAITTLTSTNGNSVMTTTISGLAVPTPSASTFSPTVTLAVLAVPGTTIAQTSTGVAPVQTTLTSTLISSSTGFQTTLATFKATLPASTWTTKVPTVTTLGLIGKVTSIVLGRTTKVTSLLQTPSTIKLLGVTSKLTKTLPLPLPAKKTSTKTIKPAPPKTTTKKTLSKTTIKVTKTTVKPKATSAARTPVGKISVLKTVTGATKPPAKTPPPPKPKKGDAAAAAAKGGMGVGMVGLGVGGVFGFAAVLL
ncbi:hypothetical protein B0A55_04315 [Friedmanniomyces simplex]|uniref:superoxide dismutase n=1 Tax=Friedmanniomyces simplex TaxID=329884 RepID=A0A4U0XI43_9PEZI|nr:hypothetical protein B0A55_04315 [Friedmanniomyces simplex]